MTSRNRVLFAWFGVASASLAAGCGGGGGSPGGGGGAPTPTPAVSAVAVGTRPLANGDTFSYGGNTTQSFVYSGVSPEPQSSASYAVVQNDTVSGPTTFAGASNVFDVSDSETDTGALQTLGVTTNTYYALVTSGATTNLVTYGFTSTDTNGESLTVTLPSPGSGAGLLDELPETKGQSWSNGPAQNLKETSPGGNASTRTVNADGSYSDVTLFPTNSIYPTSSPGQPPATHAVITQNADGSGSYAFFAATGTGGPDVNYLQIAVATPRPAASGQPALIPIVSTQPSQAPVELDIPVWYPQPLALYAETDTDTGAVAIPAACAVPATFGTAANAIVQTITQYDTVAGTQEDFAQTNYVVPSYGLACVTLAETLKFYYDYTGQSGISAGPQINITATSTLPIEVETISTTLGLTATSVSAAAAVRRTAAVAPAGAGLRVTNARSNFVALVEHEKIRRKTLLIQRLSQLMGRLHR